jgi:hypothetical protein
MRIFLTSKFAVVKTSDVMYGIVGSVNTALSGVYKSQKTFSAVANNTNFRS